MTALHIETVKLLLDLGIDPNIQAETGRTALRALQFGPNQLVKPYQALM